ncbi:hypothetical protein PQR37_19495 [Paraburkholderia nemoris]|uniref:hypothetical protein n=1 Tax=Paraburkholderia nemoris TaxID=2793076 RepID=UPI0038B71152
MMADRDRDRDRDRDALYSVRQTFVAWRRNNDSTARDAAAIGHLLNAIDDALELAAGDDTGPWQRAIERVQAMLNYVGLATEEWTLQDVVGAQYHMLVARGVTGWPAR